MKARWISISAATLFAFVITPALATEALAQKNGCLECHQSGTKTIGPGLQDIAARYKNNSGARAALIEKVKKGGKGNWTEITGGVLMPPYSPRISDADIAILVDWMLSH